MNRVTLNLVDYSFHRKIKPIQNLSLVITGVLWIIILPLLFLKNPSLSRIAAYLMLFSIMPISIFLILSIPFLFKKKVGKALLKNDRLIINEDSYSLDRVEFKLNIDQPEWTDPTKSLDQKLKSLPKWGNYIYIDSKNEFEFEPHRDIHYFTNSITIYGYDKRPALVVKTADLFKSIMSILWAAS